MDKKIEDLKKSFDSIEVPSEVDMVIELAIKRGKRAKRVNFIRPLIATVACLGILISLPSINKQPVTNEVAVKSEVVKDVLPKVASYKNLQVLLSGFENVITHESDLLNGSGLQSKTKSSMNDTSIKAPSYATADKTWDHSDTNQQVKGVDEGDTVKNDGEYIYKITGNKLVIARAVPADKLEISSQVTFEDNFYPIEILIKGNYLLVLGGQGFNELNKSVMADMIFNGGTKTRIRIYDISDKKNPYIIRSLEIDGGYSQCRMVNSSVYIVSNKYINFVGDKLKDEVPTYKDSIIGDKVNSISYDNIGYCKDALEPNYIIITSLDLANIGNKVNITTVLGSGRNIYASADNIYVAGNNAMRINYMEDRVTSDKGILTNPKEERTTIYKFKLNKNSTSFITSGWVKGSILNQFSMDESNGYFRVATTENSYGIDKSKNDLFVLNGEMKVVGKLEGLAPTERIYSARFVGDRAYMVTFKETDPLFVIDLKIPEAPKVLGELKIPGFSNYLEPYDENHLIGFGQDTVDVSVGKKKLARQMNMKIAMFDVSDVTKPVEQFHAIVKGDNSNSEVLYNHKALLFSKEKNLISFPVQYNIDYTGYYQGACVYNVDLKTGFTLKGNITHSDIKSIKDKPDLQWQAQITRELYIGDNIYTISNLAIKANNLKTLKEISELTINTESH
ncbi:MAG: beta-propeller domain-containing protein [Clostridiaceae bacterium]|nr:beta-propeller domain-containing protein [Clostridiaceae bacterium]